MMASVNRLMRCHHQSSPGIAVGIFPGFRESEPDPVRLTRGMGRFFGTKDQFHLSDGGDAHLPDMLVECGAYELWPALYWVNRDFGVEHEFQHQKSSRSCARGCSRACIEVIGCARRRKPVIP